MFSQEGGLLQDHQSAFMFQNHHGDTHGDTHIERGIGGDIHGGRVLSYSFHELVQPSEAEGRSK